jgi:hypothetical protein
MVQPVRVGVIPISNIAQLIINDLGELECFSISARQTVVRLVGFIYLNTMSVLFQFFDKPSDFSLRQESACTMMYVYEDDVCARRVVIVRIFGPIVFPGVFVVEVRP